MIQSIPKLQLLSHLLDPWGGNRLLQAARVWSGLLVLNYHRIGTADTSDFDPGLWSATAEDFSRQMRYVSQHFDIVGEADLADIHSGARRGRFVMITFDDGYRDNYEAAWPILREYGVAATFFIATGYIDNPRAPWWDDVAWMIRRSTREHIPAGEWTLQQMSLAPAERSRTLTHLLRIYKKLQASDTEGFLDFLAEVTGSGRCPAEFGADQWMTWDMIREMHRGGMSIGGHTQQHPVLGNLSASEQNVEIAGCRERIRAETGAAPRTFSYPVGKNGAFTQTTRQLVRRHDFEWAFEFDSGYCASPGFDRWAIPRAAIERDLTLPEFRSLLALPQVFA